MRAGQEFGYSVLTWGDTVLWQHLDQHDCSIQGQHSWLQSEEGARKGALKIVHLKQSLTSLPWQECILSCSRNSNKSWKLSFCVSVQLRNVHTLLDHPNQTHPPVRRTAVIAQELERCYINIEALSKIQLAEESQLREESAEWAFFWKWMLCNQKESFGDPTDWYKRQTDEAPTAPEKWLLHVFDLCLCTDND